MDTHTSSWNGNFNKRVCRVLAANMASASEELADEEEAGNESSFGGTRMRQNTLTIHHFMSIHIISNVFLLFVGDPSTNSVPYNTFIIRSAIPN